MADQPSERVKAALIHVAGLMAIALKEAEHRQHLADPHASPGSNPMTAPGDLVSQFGVTLEGLAKEVDWSIWPPKSPMP